MIRMILKFQLLLLIVWTFQTNCKADVESDDNNELEYADDEITNAPPSEVATERGEDFPSPIPVEDTTKLHLVRRTTAEQFGGHDDPVTESHNRDEVTPGPEINEKSSTGFIEPTEEPVSNKVHQKCSEDEAIQKEHVFYFMNKYLPTEVQLPSATYGRNVKLVLESGHLNLMKAQLVDQPICRDTELGPRYDIIVEFSQITGSYDWKVYNIFDRNFSEAAIITMKKLRAQFVYVDNEGKADVEDVEIGRIEDLNVKVNIPESVTSVRSFQRILKFVISRLSTLVVNRSRDTISRNIAKTLKDAVKQHDDIL